jgi:hypothetical protein
MRKMHISPNFGVLSPKVLRLIIAHKTTNADPLRGDFQP